MHIADQMTHLRIEFNTASGAHVLTHYAFDEAALRKARKWHAAQKSPPTAEQFSSWLFSNGGKLDRADGPAVTVTFQDGDRHESWWRNGKLSRVGAPAYIETHRDGTRIEQWWRNGKCIKEQTTTDLLKIPGVTIIQSQP